MPTTDDQGVEANGAEHPHEDALKRLSERLDALQASQTRPKRRFEADGQGAAYRLVAELVGGVLVGLAFGWLLDRFLNTSPWGLIIGVLLGSAVSVFLVVRTASRMGKSSD
jgi:ATP synthase protein I